MNIKISLTAAALALATPWAGAAAAPAANPPAANLPAANPVALEGSVMLEKAVEEGGVRKLVLSEPKVVVPGDRLLFSTSYRNQGSQVVTDFVVTNPVPAAVEILPESIGDAVVSVDGGKTWGQLAALSIIDSSGAKRPAKASDVTHMRWVIAAIASGASGKVQYNATVR